jgi:hypothetical protein
MLMATQASEITEGVSIGRVFSRTGSVLAANPATMFGIAFVFGAIPAIVISWFQSSLRAGILDRYEQTGVVTVAIIGGLFSFVFYALVQGALVRATMAHTEGRRASFGESAAAGLAVAVPLIAVSVLAGLGIWIGLMFLLVPGIILFCMWAVVAPALVEEHTGVFGAFGRSRELTKGARWKVFGLEAIVVIAYWIISGLFAGLLFNTQDMDALAQGQETLSIGWIVSSALLNTIVYTVWGTIQTSLYVELRTWKEGPSGKALEDIFA